MTVVLVKSVELKKDIEILSQTFERIIDRKDAILKSLVKDLEEAEEQYQTAIKSHLQNLRRLLGNCFIFKISFFCSTHAEIDSGSEFQNFYLITRN